MIKLTSSAIDYKIIFANLISEKGLTSRIYKELSIINSKIQTIQLQNWQKKKKKDEPFHSRVYTSGKHIKRCLTSTVIREMQIKITMSNDYTPIRIVKIKKRKTTKCWSQCGVNISFAGGNVK